MATDDDFDEANLPDISGQALPPPASEDGSWRLFQQRPTTLNDVLAAPPSQRRDLLEQHVRAPNASSLAPAIAASPIFPMACSFFSASISSLNDLEVGIAWVLAARDGVVGARHMERLSGSGAGAETGSADS